METKTKTRKIMEVGKGQFTITIPIEFVRKAGLKKGQKVAVTYDTVMVIVNPNLPKEK